MNKVETNPIIICRHLSLYSSVKRINNELYLATCCGVLEVEKKRDVRSIFLFDCPGFMEV